MQQCCHFVIEVSMKRLCYIRMTYVIYRISSSATARPREPVQSAACRIEWPPVDDDERRSDDQPTSHVGRAQPLAEEHAAQHDRGKRHDQGHERRVGGTGALQHREMTK